MSKEKVILGTGGEYTVETTTTETFHIKTLKAQIRAQRQGLKILVEKLAALKKAGMTEAAEDEDDA